VVLGRRTEDSPRSWRATGAQTEACPSAASLQALRPSGDRGPCPRLRARNRRPPCRRHARGPPAGPRACTPSATARARASATPSPTRRRRLHRRALTAILGPGDGGRLDGCWPSELQRKLLMTPSPDARLFRLRQARRAVSWTSLSRSQSPAASPEGAHAVLIGPVGGGFWRAAALHA